jgi:hypothetical protein
MIPINQIEGLLPFFLKLVRRLSVVIWLRRLLGFILGRLGVVLWWLSSIF